MAEYDRLLPLISQAQKLLNDNHFDELVRADDAALPRFPRQELASARAALELLKRAVEAGPLDEHTVLYRHLNYAHGGMDEGPSAYTLAQMRRHHAKNGHKGDLANRWGKSLDGSGEYGHTHEERA